MPFVNALSDDGCSYKSTQHPVSVHVVAAEFYVLEALGILSGKLEPFKRSSEKFKYDLFSYKSEFEEIVSVMMLDYITFASAGESRHGYRKAGIYLDEVPQGGSRDYVAECIKKFTPKSISKATYALFEEDDWEDGYGGHKWATIADAINYYYTLPKTAFIDHCFDLSHNGGCAFNKYDYHIFCIGNSDFVDFMNDKTSSETPEDLIGAVITHEFHRCLSSRTKNLLLRAENLGILDFESTAGITLSEIDFSRHTEDRHEQIERIFNEYIPVEWGNEELDDDFSVNRRRRNFSGHCNIDEWDEDHCDYCDDISCGEHPDHMDKCYELPEDKCCGYEDCGNTSCGSHPQYYEHNGYEWISPTCEEDEVEDNVCLGDVDLFDEQPKKPNKGVLINVRKVLF